MPKGVKGFKIGHSVRNTGRTHIKKGQHFSPATEFKKGDNTGEKSYRYNGGLCFDKRKNRWLIWCRDNTYVAFARAVMESALKRQLESFELVHHRDNDSTNDELSNLKIVSRAIHPQIHKPRLKKGAKE